MDMAGDGGDGGDDSDAGRLLSRFSITACPLCLFGSRVPMPGEAQLTGLAPQPQFAGARLLRGGRRHPCRSPGAPEPRSPGAPQSGGPAAQRSLRPLGGGPFALPAP